MTPIVLYNGYVIIFVHGILLKRAHGTVLQASRLRGAHKQHTEMSVAGPLQ
jgi:hypothetical protein